MVISATGEVPEVTVTDCAGPLPQISTAETEMVPPIAPTLTVIKFVVDEPLQPLGNVQV